MMDSLRGFAALYVVVYHASWILTAGGQRLIEQHAFLRMLGQRNLLGLASFGRFAVLVFFVLSGFAIHSRQADVDGSRLLPPGRWLFEYLWRRGMRIYPPLVFAIVATAALGQIGTRIAGVRFDDVVSASFRPTLAILMLLGRASTYGNDGSLWSLQYELWFYALYPPFLYFLWRRAGMWVAIVGMAVLGLGLSLSDGLLGSRVSSMAGFAPAALTYFALFVAGMGLAEAYHRRQVVRHRGALKVAGFLSLVLALLAYSPDAAGVLFDYLFGFGVVLLLGSMLLGQQVPQVSTIMYSLARVAPWSYSLYLLHLPALLLVRAVWMQRWPLPASPALAVVGCVIAMFVGIGGWLLVERWTTKLAQRPPRFVRQPVLAERASTAVRGGMSN